MILVVLFMGIYYVMSAPSQRITVQETEYAIEQADLKSVAECTRAVHSAQINGGTFNDICVEQNGIMSRYVCLNTQMVETPCEIVKGKKPTYSFIITATKPLDPDNYNNMMEILEHDYADAGTFGLFYNNAVFTGGDTSKHSVPKTIIDSFGLADGALIYMTQYEIPDATASFTMAGFDNVVCPSGTTKTYRFGRWQCIPFNTKTTCSGDTVWDYDTMSCVADESRKPLCIGSQTAVMIDTFWECVDPFPDRECPSGTIARLDYETLVWECVKDPSQNKNITKCDNIINYAIRGGTGRNSQTSCTDCEKMITNTETCESFCVPDETQVKNPACYSGTCSGTNKGMYFGFPSVQYVLNADVVSKMSVPLDAKHSQNRRFNCMDCSSRGGINRDKSLPPFVTVCNEN